MRCSVLPPQSNFIRKATVCLLSFIPICAESEAVGMVIKMKRLWMAVLLLAALLSLCLVNAWYSLTLTRQLSEQLDQAQALVEQDQWDQARSITQEVYDSWNGHHFYLHVFLRHSDTDQILRTFRQVIQYLDLEELDQYAAANADLVAQLELLSEMEQPSLVNIL